MTSEPETKDSRQKLTPLIFLSKYKRCFRPPFRTGKETRKMNAECEGGDGVPWGTGGERKTYYLWSTCLRFIRLAINRISSLRYARSPARLRPRPRLSPRSCHGRDNNADNHRMRSGGRSPRAWRRRRRGGGEVSLGPKISRAEDHKRRVVADRGGRIS